MVANPDITPTFEFSPCSRLFDRNPEFAPTLRIHSGDSAWVQKSKRISGDKGVLRTNVADFAKKVTMMSALAD
jgi:hypothetical protein